MAGHGFSRRSCGFVLLFALGMATSQADAQSAQLAAVDWGTALRWYDIASYPFSTRNFSYFANPTVIVEYQTSGAAFTGTIHATGLKPNFAYQIKLNGKPTRTWGAGGDDWSNEQLGYAGRWWLTRYLHGTNTQVDGKNSSDAEYQQWKAAGFTDGVYDYVFEGYLLFDYIVTDTAGNADPVGFTLDSSLHVLWRVANRTPTANDSAVTPYTVIARASSGWYAQDYATAIVQLYGEWEPTRPLPGHVVLPAGNYNVRIFLTEESFHETGTDRGNWATVMTHDAIQFAIPNHPPVAVNDAATTTEGTPVTIPVLANDSDPDHDPLTVTSVTQGSNGVATISPDGTTVTYTPNPGFAGTDAFTYTISDSRGGTASATVTVTVTAVPPVAQSQSVTTVENTPVNITLVATDPAADGDPLTYSVVAGPSHGALSGAAPYLIYTPAAGYNGLDSFTFRANEGLAVSNTATVTITVNPAANVAIAMTKKGTTKSWNAVAAVTITTGSGSALGSATVYGHWSGACSGNVSASTNASGKVAFNSPSMRGSGTATFTVDRVVKKGKTYVVLGVTSRSITGP